MEHHLETIVKIGEYSERCVYEGEGFMSDIALYALGRWDEREEKTWDLETYVDQLKFRFKVDWRPDGHTQG